MPFASRLMMCVGKALLKCAGNAIGVGIIGDLVVELAPDLAETVWSEWNQERTAEEERAEIEALAQVTHGEAREYAETVVETLAPNESQQVKETLRTYLVQVPATIRKSLRRPSDPTGKTIPPGLQLSKPGDLLEFLPSSLPRFLPGDRPLGGTDLVLEQLLGAGGFGEVWKATPDLDGLQPVALKFFYELDEHGKKSIQQEANLLNRMMREGPPKGIVQLQRTYLSAEPACLEYEYIEGSDLASLITEWHRSRGGPTAEEAARVILRLAEIMETPHCYREPIVHRDLKPANILVYQDVSQNYTFKITDFGIGAIAAKLAIREETRSASRGGLSQFTSMKGSYTPLYASPQQMNGAGPDIRDDIFSLGVIWYQLLTGKLTDGRPGGSRWRGRLQAKAGCEELLDLMESCFEDEPDDRPANAMVLVFELRRVLSQSMNNATDPNSTSAQNSVRPLPESARECLVLGNASFQQADYPRAIECYARAIELNPRYHPAYLNRGNCYLKMGDFPTAIEDFNEAIRLKSDYASAYKNRGIAHKNLRQFPQARQDISTLIELNSENADAYSQRAKVYLLEEDFAKAIADVEQALKIAPENTALYLDRARISIKLADYDRAIQDCGRLLLENPRNLTALVVQGIAQKSKTDYDEALATFQRANTYALEETPVSSVAVNSLAWFYATCPDPAFHDAQAAIRHATTACEASEWKSPGILDTLAAAFARAGLFDEAIRWQETAISLGSELNQPDYERRLELYRNKTAYIDS